jgi:hypothetical protein
MIGQPTYLYRQICVIQSTCLRSILKLSFQLYLDLSSSILYQYSETNVMHILFTLLRTKGPYMFRAYPQGGATQAALGKLRA